MPENSYTGIGLFKKEHLNLLPDEIKSAAMFEIKLTKDCGISAKELCDYLQLAKEALLKSIELHPEGKELPFHLIFEIRVPI